MSDRLYGLPDAEHLRFDPEDVLEDHEPGTYTIEEWTIAPARSHLPPIDSVLDWISEWSAENGEGDEQLDDDVRQSCSSAVVEAAAEALLDTIADGIRHRMADKCVATHTAVLEREGEFNIVTLLTMAPAPEGEYETFRDGATPGWRES